MIYLTYDNKSLQDGLGAQAQRMLSIYWISRIYGWQYIHSPIIHAEHITDTKIIDSFNHLVSIPSNTMTLFDNTIQMKVIKIDQIQSYQKNKHNILFKITFAHNFIDTHPTLLSHNHSPSFDWIQKTINHPVTIAVHIRRGDVTPNIHCERYINLSYYLDCIDCLQAILTQNKIKYEIHVYSEGNIETAINLRTNFFLHIDANVIDTFTAFVNADILFTGFSSFSYTPVFLRKKGCVLYTPFWHTFPHTAIKVQSPDDIRSHQEQIINSLTK
jgi:hypothetical protein